MTFDESVLDNAAQLESRDEYRLLWSLATAGAQVRRAIELRDEFGVDQLTGYPPRSILIATDSAPSSANRLLTRLGNEVAPSIAWHGVELPKWAGPADALLVGAFDGRHPRLAGLAEQASRRGLALAIVAPPGSQVAAAAGRAPVHELSEGLNPSAARWALLTPLLQALEALGVQQFPPSLFEQIADALDETAEMCRPDSESFTNPAKSLAVEFSETRPVIAGAGPLAGVAAKLTADALHLMSGVSAIGVTLPDGVARAGSLLRGAGPAPASDFFRDRLEAEAGQRARLLIIGDDGEPADAVLGEPTEAQVQLDEMAARRAATALHQLAHQLGVRSSSVQVPDAPVLARFAAATAFGEYAAAYLGFGLGLDPGARRPAELVH